MPEGFWQAREQHAMSLGGSPLANASSLPELLEKLKTAVSEDYIKKMLSDSDFYIDIFFAEELL